MNNTALKYGFLFVFLILLQVLVLNNVLLWGYINPMLYIVFIFLYPLKKEKGTFLVLSFLLGLSIDFFSNSGGINAAATLFIAYNRIFILNIVQNNADFDYLLFNLKKLTLAQAIAYVLSLTFIHHTIVYFLAYYKLSSFLNIIEKITVSTILTTILLGFIIILFVKDKK